MNSVRSENLYSAIYEHKLQHEILVEKILSVVACEKIFLLATTFMSHNVENILTTCSTTPMRISHYHVLVVVPRTGKSGNMEVQDKIEGRLQHFIPTTVLVLDTEQFNDWIKQRHPFAVKTINSDYLLYGERETVEKNLEITDYKDQQTKLESIFAQGQNKAQEFLAGADLFRIREQNRMAAFMLHQSLEQILRSLTLTLTGLEIATHSLDKLLRFCSMFYYRLSEIFRSEDGKTEKIFQLLQRAYIAARYKDDYHINTADLISLKEKMEAILNICENMVKEFLSQVE